IPLLQLASVTGLYGVSFLVCWCSLALFGAFAMLVCQPQRRWGWMSEARLPLIVLLFVMAWGFWRMVGIRRQDLEQSDRVSIALVQPAVPETLLWDEAKGVEHAEKLRRLSEQALALRPEILIWPEGGYGLDAANYRAMTNLTVTAGAAWVFNHIDEESPTNGVARFFNANFMVSAKGRIEAVYHKRRLVIFGEYVPLEKWLPFLHWLTPIGSSFTPGDDPTYFNFAEAGLEASPLICFENVFPHGLRDQVRPSTDFLLELTNDGWFGEGCAQWQHAAHSAFRAVENGVSLVRCTNNGLTCWFDRAGVMRDLFVGNGGSVYGEGWESIGLPRNGGALPTLYRARGDWFAWACVVMAGWSFLRARLASRRRPVEKEEEST
ncbi:MAG TPA: apolipoprotein N-acyltransferase, partial [Candidatus Limnocylindria bacterium]|nr:apolipoprotein N-acyltransferase [Candidatus Limnocylindria bacterium]